MTALQGARAALLLFVVAILQVSAFATVSLGGASPDVLLVTLVAVAFLRGSIFGACAGFAAGLVVDVATLETLGVTALLFTLVGFWAGRYGETTGRGRARAPFVAALAAAAFFEVGGYVLDALLGGPAELTSLLVALPAALLWSGVLAYPVFRLVRRIVGAAGPVDRAREVEVLV